MSMLIQRATFKIDTTQVGIDKLVDLDYMGAAEFEFGAVPKQINELREFGSKLEIFCEPAIHNEIDVAKLHSRFFSEKEAHNRVGKYPNLFVLTPRELLERTTHDVIELLRGNDYVKETSLLYNINKNNFYNDLSVDVWISLDQYWIASFSQEKLNIIRECLIDSSKKTPVNLRKKLSVDDKIYFYHNDRVWTGRVTAVYNDTNAIDAVYDGGEITLNVDNVILR